MKWLRAAESALLVVLLAGMIGIAAWQVIARNFFDTGLVWGDALVRVLVLWVAMFGAMVASRTDDHIRIDLANRFLPPQFRDPLRRLMALATSAILAIFTWASYDFVRFEYEDGTIAFANVPAWLCEAVLPLGAGIMCLRYLVHTFRLPPIAAESDQTEVS